MIIKFKQGLRCIFCGKELIQPVIMSHLQEVLNLSPIYRCMWYADNDPDCNPTCNGFGMNTNERIEWIKAHF
jgi:hypothetical protein